MTDIDQKLETLYDLLIDNSELLEAELKDLITNPNKIKDTNKFASLLSELHNSAFINPLLSTISISSKDDVWLPDFLYAVINLLEESSENEAFDVPENLIENLQVWILENKGELSWKAVILLKLCQSDSTEEIFLKKLEERDDFFLTYVECVSGLLKYDKDKYFPLLVQIANDETRNGHLREFCTENILKYS
ncbi:MULTISPECIES: hypothetical protein [unclassified Arcicella]|uniref:hypothetical protein n=1 Tax=unclassified Arcicella TaxID=2644986 RepID=UPI00285E9739|nr:MULTISPECIES: hypothetical protein [unclassified Arcicella]MDR6561019.1 hypothetical protein [Arcicella sp. BE51]MDR6810903.1 hypothetical protein [Arcicella sp. BE140]MDR6822253.1 hypothetical protein [Arcicella sp. BE139]